MDVAFLRAGFLPRIGHLDRAEAAAFDRGKEFAKDFSSATKELESARREWHEAMKRARELPTGEKEKEPAALEKLKDAIANVSVGAIREKTMDVAGTFSTSTLFGLGGMSANERTARATEETAENTKRMITEIQQGGLSFT